MLGLAVAILGELLGRALLGVGGSVGLVHALLQVAICLVLLLGGVEDVLGLLGGPLLHGLPLSGVYGVCLSLARHTFVALARGWLWLRAAVASPLVAVGSHLLGALARRSELRST